MRRARSYGLAVAGLPGSAGPGRAAAGQRLALAALVAGQIAGTAAGLVLIRAVAATGDVWARELSAMVVVGPFAGLLAVAGLAHRRDARAVAPPGPAGLSIILLALVLYSGTAGDVVRLIGVAARARRPARCSATARARARAPPEPAREAGAGGAGRRGDRDRAAGRRAVPHAGRALGRPRPPVRLEPAAPRTAARGVRAGG